MPFFKTSILIGWNQSSIFHLEFIHNFTLLNLKFKWKEINLQRNDVIAKQLVSDIFLKRKKFNLILKGTDFETQIWSKLTNLNVQKPAGCDAGVSLRRLDRRQRSFLIFLNFS